jgi:hypothetical protein
MIYDLPKASRFFCIFMYITTVIQATETLSLSFVYTIQVLVIYYLPLCESLREPNPLNHSEPLSLCAVTLDP